ncbi:MAG: Polyribonucleotide nucleotidyltransferase [candidate division WS2 bacterium]|uniref:Polyribonucleotide nucleotidyltransferase n=1 Tax=Psychracetigena formicireducens TaxID=2986056 RepID=A0A9E2BG43_PSYF1|nr:Polyribonucleotide nucleotidyltransferase [Candidatus Psychracetigena formicireducens]
MNKIRKTIEYFGRILELSTGDWAKQAGGSVLVRYGDTVVLVAVTADKKDKEDLDFLPLTVEYSERMYAAGKIPGGYFRREGRPTEEEILKSRLIDRSIRSLFPAEYKKEVLVVATVLSVDQENLPDILGIIGASATLCLSNIPFSIPLGAVRIGKINGEFVVNPIAQELDMSSLDLVVTATKDNVVMIEANAKEIPEEQILEAVIIAREAIEPIINLITELVKEVNPQKDILKTVEYDKELVDKVKRFVEERFSRGDFQTGDKLQREDAMYLLLEEGVEYFKEDCSGKEALIRSIVFKYFKSALRYQVIHDKIRIDGRKPDEVREIGVTTGVLPRVHGSAVFSRGQTQVLTTVTLGAFQDVQHIDGLGMDEYKRYMHHYNFPPYSVGEARPMRGPGRREIGHGSLAERAIVPILPEEETFPYTIRTVSEVLESNGSTSMASVCGSSLALMDAGVPIVSPVAGISIGLIKEGPEYALLVDIQGIEDALGDMDFKVAGTRTGVTAIQLDNKTVGIEVNLLKEAFEEARKSRNFILDCMENNISSSRTDLSLYAPHITSFEIEAGKIGELIGPGGRVIRKISQDTGAQIDIKDSVGKGYITAPSKEALQKAQKYIDAILKGVKVGETYEGRVTRIVPFGVFVEIAPSKEGLLHNSQIINTYKSRGQVSLNINDQVMVVVKEIDHLGRINLTQKGSTED